MVLMCLNPEPMDLDAVIGRLATPMTLLMTWERLPFNWL
jgi:hypothetical protein